MHLTDADIAKLGTLGRLELTPEQRHTYAEQLSRIVAYTDRIAEADVSATQHVLRLPVSADALRADDVQAGSDNLAADLAPKREGKFIVSPPIA